MYKKKKISNFVDKYALEFVLHDYNELKELLSSVNKINSIISNIEKLSVEDKYYVLSTIIDYKDYNFDKNDISIVLKDKLSMLKNFKSSTECPNLDKIYYAFKSNESLYHLFVEEYSKYHITSKYVVKVLPGLEDYSDVVTKYCKEFHDLQTKNNSIITLRNDLLSLKPEQLDILFSFAWNGLDLLQKVYKNIIGSDHHTIYDISLLSNDGFEEMVQFIFSVNEGKNEALIDAKLKLIPELLNNSNIDDENRLNKNLLENLSSLPKEYILKLAEEEPNNIGKKLLFNYLSEENKISKRVVASIISSSIDFLEYYEEIYTLITYKSFYKYDDNIKELLVKELPRKCEEGSQVLKTKINYFINYALFKEKQEKINVVDDFLFINDTINFIKEEENFELLEARLETVKYATEQFFLNKISQEEYCSCLKTLEFGLNEKKNNAEKIKYLEFGSRYIVDNKLFNIVEETTSKENVCKSFLGNLSYDKNELLDFDSYNKKSKVLTKQIKKN